MRIAIALLSLAAAGGSALAAKSDVVEGNPSSAVRVLIYEDLQCNDCSTFRNLLDEKLLPKYGSKVAFVHRDFPLGKHEWARQAAMAARWVYEHNPELGINFRRELMAQQSNISPKTLKYWVLEFAARNYLDQQGIIDSMSDQRLATLVDQDRQGGIARGVLRTPTVFVGGDAFVETIIYEDLARALDQALAK